MFGSLPDPSSYQEKKKSEEELEQALQERQENVEEERFSWRFGQLVEAGADYRDAIRLANEPQLDLHKATDMLKDGCDSQLLVEILT